MALGNPEISYEAEWKDGSKLDNLLKDDSSALQDDGACGDRIELDEDNSMDNRTHMDVCPCVEDMAGSISQHTLDVHVGAYIDVDDMDAFLLA